VFLKWEKPFHLIWYRWKHNYFIFFPEREGVSAYKVFVPDIFEVILVSLVSCMSKDSLDLVVLFLLSIGIDVIARMGLVELFKIFDIVGIVGYSDTAAGGPQLVA
jgi:hypothetical protein